MENLTKTPALIDGKNMTEDFVEYIADNCNIARGAKGEMKKGILFYFQKTAVEAEWIVNSNEMKFSFNGNIPYKSFTDAVSELFDSKESEVSAEFTYWDDCIVLSFYHKNIE